MASQVGDLLVNMPSDNIRRKRLNGQQKREALEREVSMLQKMLNQEEKMHKILEDIQHRPDGAAISIPNFLPAKVKELLAELAMVEGEITRLESQISQLQLGLKQEQEFTKNTKSKQWQPGVLNKLQGSYPSNAALSSPLNRSTVVQEEQEITKDLKSRQWPPGVLSKLQGNSSNSTATMSSPFINESVQEKITFDTKALHFISKAIKGDYNISDFTLHEKIRNSRMFSDRKENKFHEEVKLQERVPRKSGLLKSPSPLRDPRHPTPRPSRERNLEISLDLPPKAISSAFLPEESIENWQPNKLSESIMKCLNFIYIRLLRTSRAMELEKLGQTASRSIHSSLSSRSFRAETSLNSKPALSSQKEVRQQDPYGIFNTEESIPRDIGPYKHLVIFTASSMDPKCISSSSSIPLLKKLRVLMNNLQTVDLRSLTFQQKLAFWINMYNACVMHGFLQYGVPGTPDKLFTVMNKAAINISGHTINAQAIEHFILRKSAASSMREVLQKGDKEDEETIVGKLYGLESMDPNVTFALCCGTRSSPAVKIYTADNVIAELEKSKLEYLQASIIVTSTKKIAFPELLLRNMHDFAMDMGALIEWVCHQLPTSGTLRKSMVDCFRGLNSGRISPAVDKIPYDYEFQYLLVM